MWFLFALPDNREKAPQALAAGSIGANKSYRMKCHSKGQLYFSWGLRGVRLPQATMIPPCSCCAPGGSRRKVEHPRGIGGEVESKAQTGAPLCGDKGGRKVGCGWYSCLKKHASPPKSSWAALLLFQNYRSYILAEIWVKGWWRAEVREATQSKGKASVWTPDNDTPKWIYHHSGYFKKSHWGKKSA